MLSESGFVKKGTILMEATPFVYVLLDKYQSMRCDYCLSNEKEMHKCSDCHYVYYCNRDCQKQAWKIHKYECKNIKRCQPLTLPDTARLMARIIIKLRDRKRNEKGYYMANKYRTFHVMMSHSKEIRQSSNKMEHLYSLKCVLNDFFGKTNSCIPEFEELLEIYGRVNTNSFHISHNLENIAIGIYLGPSILDHSCIPNANVTFEGTKLYVRALQDFSEYDVSKIRISYVDLLQSAKARQKELEETYYFTCNCTKCEQPDLKSNAMACSNAQCTNCCNINDDECSQCRCTLDRKLKERFKVVMKFTDSKMQEMKENKDMESIEKCLEMQTKILHDMNVKRIKTWELAVEVAINSSLWEKALYFTKQVLPGYKEYYKEHHLATIDLYLTLAKIQMYLEKLSDAVRTLVEIKPVLLMSYGKDHYYTKLLKSMLLKCEISMYGYNTDENVIDKNSFCK